MPIRKTYSKRVKKPYARRYRKKRYTRPRLSRQVGVPSSMFTKLRYNGIYSASIGTGGLSTRIWSLNNLYDPDVSGIGGQPLFFDQYTSMYRSYRVYGVKVMAVFSFGSSTNNCYHPTVCMVPSTSSSSTSDINVAVSMKGASWTTVVPSQGKARFSKYYSIASYFGVSKKAVQGEDNFSALTGAAPANQLYFHMYAFNNDATNTFPMTTELRLTYYVKFYSPVQVAAS